MSETDLPKTESYRGLYTTIGILVGLYVVAVFVLAIWWSQEPAPFNVYDEAVKRLKVTQTEKMPVGYTYANTLAHIAEVILYKPGGYLSNDVAPPGVLLDNIPNWELGALVMLRDATTALRNHFARDQSQSAEDPDLAKAEPYFYYERNSWALPSTEAEYSKGIEALHRYMGRLQDEKARVPANFFVRADNLWQYIEIVIKRLGGLSTRLTASTLLEGENRILAPGVFEDPRQLGEQERSIMEENQTRSLKRTTFFQIDDIFYEARGASWALLHILKATEHDFQSILFDKRAMNTVDIIISSMERSLGPVLSPLFILNGTGYGLFANYSLTMANYIARANAAALDLRDLMNRG
ncbi:MAG: DUF2333 family protein [Methylococcales bacterium]|nr:DUF2333 family protein [Methylococcales bacterium]